MLQPFKEKIEADGDACMINFFSRSEDMFQIDEYGMDIGDALLVIDNLVRRFDIDIETLSETLKFKKSLYEARNKST